jgi:predicted alpha/beta-hydrolase family hydrolase
LVSIEVDNGKIELEADLIIPSNKNGNYSKGIVLFAHGSGSSRHSPRNKYVAEVLQKDGLPTLLVDLLTIMEEEVDTKAQGVSYKIPGFVLNKFNINLLARRLVSITDWILENPGTKDFSVGYFGASTGTAAAIVAAAQRHAKNNNSNDAFAFVSRSGRPDLAGLDYLSKVKAPTLLIVGGNDSKKVIDINNEALKQLGSERKKLVTIPNATHLFEEPGTLEEVARLASGWFRCYYLIKNEHDNGS